MKGAAHPKERRYYMEQTEKIATINRQLRDMFGIDTVSGQPMWRVVWANNVLEKRLMTHTNSGIALLYPEVREVRKYNAVKDRYILERLIGIDDPALQAEYPDQKTYYNPMWTFSDRYGRYLPPYFEGCQFIINQVYSKEGKPSVPYADPELDPETKRKRLDGIINELFGEHPGFTEARGDTIIGMHPKKDN